MESFKACEGDFIETLEGLIFDVKGLIHPPDRVIAYLRYVEDPMGDRKRGGKAYIKVYSLSERRRVLERSYPQYLFYDKVFGEYLEGVSVHRISKHYQPIRKVSELLNKQEPDYVETQAIDFIQHLHDISNVPLRKLGISGSILIGLHVEASDIDPIVYGRENCIAIHKALKHSMQKEGGSIQPYSLRDLEKLYEFRLKDTQMPLKDFLRMERRKFFQGKFKGRDFFIRFIPDWDEVGEKYGDRLYIPIGYAKIKAKIKDDSDSIFTPCRYVISEAKVLDGTKAPTLKEIVSFRGRFCEQAKKDELIVAQGKVEKVVEKDGTEYFRLVLGAKPSDFMVSE